MACCKETFDRRKLDFNGYDRNWPLVFSVSSLDILGANPPQWSLPYFGIRSFLFLLMFSIWVWSLAASECIGVYFMYLTNITLTLQTVYLGCAAFTCWSGKEYVSNVSAAPRGPWHVHVTWLLFAIEVPATFMVFVLYWALVYPSKTDPVDALSYLTHGVNFIVALLDFWLSKAPAYMIHAVYFFSYALLYLVLSVLFWASGSRTCGKDCGANAANETCLSAGDGRCAWSNSTAAPFCVGGNDGGDNFLYSSLDFNRGTSTYMLSAILLFAAVPLVNAMFVYLIQFCRRTGGDVVAPSDD